MRMDARLLFNMVATILSVFSSKSMQQNPGYSKCILANLEKLFPPWAWNPCFKCDCNYKEGNSEICKVNRITCEDLQCSLVEHDPKVCCKVCKGCRIKNRYYKDKEIWKDGNNNCTTYQCNEGVVSNITPQCVTDCEQTIQVKGECCPTCAGCRYGNRLIAEGAKVNVDHCTTCLCQGGSLTCKKQTCPHLYCVNPKPQEGKCCPECPPTETPQKVDKTEQNCFVKGLSLRSGITYQVDKCTKCQCMNGTLSCNRQRCEVDKNCKSGKLVKSETHCCPICADKILCKFNGKIYQNKARWFLRGCAECECLDGHIKCRKQICKKDLKCPTGYIATYRPGSCCQECLKERSRCISFGDPHYRTFDGKAYSYQGICKYTLAKDCTPSKTFSIITRNDGRYSSSFSWIKSVVFKYANLTISLQQKHRVKINGKIVRIPLLYNSHIDIRRIKRYIFVYTQHGITIKWDGDGYVEVALPKSFMNKVCGLCGNYNSNPDDDFTLPNGLRLQSEIMFGNFWRKKGSKSCKRNSHLFNRLKYSSCVGWKLFHAQKICTKAFSDVSISNCKMNEPIDNYFHDCVTDVCQCPSGKHHCECGAIRSYFERCSQLVTNITWKRKSKCDTSCTGGSVYSSCGNVCRNTCNSLNSVEVCHQTCVPGCYCLRGQVWHEGKCILMEDCP